MRATILRAVATPIRPRHPFFDWPGPIAMAHRGGASEAPENTLPAFQRAVDLGYRYLETDVHATADGVVVAFHDDDLTRTCGRRGRIRDLRWSELSTVRVRGAAPIPRLDELLEAFPDVRFNIDCKTDRVVGPLGDDLTRCDALGRVCVGSFSDRRLLRMRRRFGQQLCTSAGPVEISMLRFTHLAPPGPLAAQVPVRIRGVTVITRRFVAACHRRGIEVHAWTIDDPDEMERLLDLGVDGLMTDVPATLKDVLSRRGEWNG
jgi:glycerophosphoryl diester phosphodiesterase